MVLPVLRPGLCLSRQLEGQLEGTDPTAPLAGAPPLAWQASQCRLLFQLSNPEHLHYSNAATLALSACASKLKIPHAQGAARHGL